MAEILEQLSKMTCAERIRIAQWILEGIANGEVASYSGGKVDVSKRIGLMNGMEKIPSYEKDREMDEEIVADCDFP